LDIQLLAAAIFAAAGLAAGPSSAASADLAVVRGDLRFATGAVTNVAWRDPVFIWLRVARPSLSETVLPFRVDSMAQLSALGWKAESVPVGEQITVQYLPFSHGEPGGKLVRLTLASGLFMETPDSLSAP
jgi:hypothetical protein